jgi:glycosyltransferase involved in cell wall biosynthesis
MRAVVVSCVFPPEPVVSSRTSFDVAQELSKRGHEVTVLAPFPNRPGGTLYAGYRRALFRRERSREGFTIIRCGSFFSRQSSVISRMAENVSFGITSALALLTRRKPAVIYANSWPIFASALIAAVARLRRIPLVVSVQDVYPESLMSQQRAGSSVAGGALLAIDRWVVRRAAAVVVISERFAELYSKTRGVDRSRLHVVPNWSSDAPETSSAGDCRERHGISRDAFLVAYGGNVSFAAAVESVIEAFGDLADQKDVHLLIAGEGAMLDHCRRLAATIAPRQIHFESPWTDTMGVLRAADVLVLPTRDRQSMASVPSKLISYLLAARPVLAMAVGESDTAAAVAASGAGIVLPPGDSAKLAGAIRSMAGKPAEERRQIGEAGRAWALANVTRDVCLPRLIGVIEEQSR